MDAALIVNTQARANKMLVSMEREKYAKLNNVHIVSVEEADYLIKQ